MIRNFLFTFLIFVYSFNAFSRDLGYQEFLTRWPQYKTTLSDSIGPAVAYFYILDGLGYPKEKLLSWLQGHGCGLKNKPMTPEESKIVKGVLAKLYLETPNQPIMIPESGSNLNNKHSLESFFQALSRNKQNLSALNHNPVRRFARGHLDIIFPSNKLIENPLSSSPPWLEPSTLNQIGSQEVTNNQILQKQFLIEKVKKEGLLPENLNAIAKNL